MVALSLLAPSPAPAQDIAKFEQFMTGFFSPATLLSPPGEPERLLVVELSGVIHVIENGVRRSTPFLDIRSRVRMQNGLIGVAFPPDYATSRRFYVNYTGNVGDGPRLARYTTSANPNVANTTEELLLETAEGIGDHCAGWMDFGPDGYLYIARGDVGGDPQDPTVAMGKILRLDVSTPTGYAIPPSNPYVGTTGMDEVVALGLRNPWRNSFDKLTGDLYIADVGSVTREEINYVPAGTLVGRNFGWPCVEGDTCQISQPPCNCFASSLTEPIYSYGRDLGGCVIGGTVYRGSAIPRWRGRYFFMDCSDNRIYSFRPVNGVATDFQEHTWELNDGLPPERGILTPIAFGADAENELYVMELGGRILKIVPEVPVADWNIDGAINSADFFDFLGDFFNGNADLDGDNLSGSTDFFEFLRAFFEA